MTIREGVHKVTCNACGAEGTIRVSRQLTRNRVRVPDDNVVHAETCPHFKREQPRHLKQKAWRKQEREANALVGVRETLASGAVGEDGDGRSFHGWRVESKGTTAAAYRLTQQVWAKLVIGALRAGEEPLLNVIVHRGDKGKETELLIVRRDLYEATPELPQALWEPHLLENDNSHVWMSHRVDGRPTPYLVTLDPHGVVVSREQFIHIRGAADVSSGGPVPGP